MAGQQGYKALTVKTINNTIDLCHSWWNEPSLCILCCWLF